MNLTDISTIKTLCAAHGFSLSKEFGQNFIVNPGICPKRRRGLTSASACWRSAPAWGC